LNYWIESGINTTTTKIWVKVPSIPASSSKTIYVYYGNPSATSLSSVANTFIREIDGALPVKGSWHFDEGSGTIAFDSSGNNNNGTLVNGPAWVDGKFGKALSFDGVDDYVSIPNSPSINLGTDDFTLVAWIKAAISQPTYPQILSKRSTTNDGFLFGLWFNGKLYMQIQGTNYPTATGPDLRDNNWHHVVAVRSGSTVTYYIDGANKGSFTSTASMSSTHALWIGRDEPAPSTTPFNGLIDEVLIYKRALGEEEISDLYNYYGYTTTNYSGRVLVRKYTSPEPTTSVGTEEKRSSIILLIL
jgi:hypothetical protein